jgi:hypothetical protein
MTCTWDKVSRVDVATLHGKGRGYFKRALRWALEARKRGFDALILVIDEDHRPERITEVAEAQDDLTVEAPRALGVAIHTFDAWMLADQQALSLVLGTQVATQPNPEAIGDAKTRCHELMNGSNCQHSQSELYAQIARSLSITRLQERCPNGFGVFAERVRALHTAAT